MLITKGVEQDPLTVYAVDWAAYDLLLAEATRDYLLNAIQRGAASLDASLDVTNPHVLHWIQHYSGLMANRVSDTVREGIRQALIEGIQAGESSRAMRDRVLEAFGCKRDEVGKIIADEKLKYRAEMIARTEDHRAQTAGQRETARQMGAVSIVWEAAPSACEFCAAIDGRVVGVADNFYAKGDSMSITDSEGNERTMHFDYSDVEGPPAHPWCRCTLSVNTE
jgi:hypothetical protein